MSDFADRLIAWHAHSGRHDLPWQNTTDPYRIWLSEIMLQQTQVDTVIPYYARFLARCPTLASLADAPADDVMALWAGLGYYARARNLHACAKQVMAEFGGEFPQTPEQIATLPGIGRSTAAAIAAFAFGQHAAILDGNVKRVLCRVFGVEGFPGSVPVERKLWDLAEDLLPKKNIQTYTQAQMDLGATVCVRGTPKCERCPMAEICVAHTTGRTAELPEARPRKKPPIRSTQMAVVTDGERVLLVQRPPKGIWGGLLSLPEFESEMAPEDWWRAFAGEVAVTVSALPELRHTFTHYVLDISPVRFEVGNMDSIGEIGAGRVVSLEEAKGLGLPKPVSRILGFG
ncbi:A/G-specific adenine glycosylase [Nitrogeniibacter aestuarii]|uniref:A/G-specific adenine glycosylase n=1 Tax=Nitrogeniibacter aestuarii TaxID=2815343 RepID=UPI001E5E1AAC|nr:A/G-specific adenine glycosylase [Nitrogeniibacter aestuarii]